MPMTFEEWKVKAGEFPSMGAAERWRTENNVEVEGLPNPQAAGQWRTQLGEQPSGGLSVAAQQPQTAAPQQPNRNPMSEEQSLREAIMGYPAKQKTAREAQFKAAQERIAQMYGGPSQSQMLFALSQALLAPRKYSGFAGTMYNVSQALGGIGKAREDAMRKRAEAELELKQAYDTGAEKDELEALKLRYQLVKEANDLAAERAKAGQPKYQFDPTTGSWNIQPGTGGVPPMNARGQYVVSSPEQAANVPKGKEFVYAGDDTGKTYYGR